MSTRTTFIGALALVFILVAGVMTAVHIVDKHNSEMAVMAVQADNYKLDAKAKEAQISDLTKANADLSKQKVKVETRIEYRDRDTAAQVQKVTDPSLSLTTVANRSAQVLNARPEIVGNKLAFEKPQVQGFIANKIALDAASANVVDLHALLTDQEQQTKNNGAALALEVQRREAAEKLMNGYKGVAGASTKAKVVRGLEVGGAIGVTAWVAFHIGRAMAH